MYVILDTDAIYHDFYLSKPATRELLEQAPSREITVCIPEVVLLEMEADFREELRSRSDALDKATAGIADLLQAENIQSSVIDIETEITNYRVRLRAILSRFNIRILPAPRIDVNDLLVRGIHRRKPFKKDGRGLFDALIWASVVELFCSDPLRQIAMITHDKDYADVEYSDVNNARLHQDLQDDLGVPSIEAISLHGQPVTPTNSERAGFAELHKSIQLFNTSWIRRTSLS